MPSPANGLSDSVAERNNARTFTEEDERKLFALHRGKNNACGPGATTHERDLSLPNVARVFDLDAELLRGLDVGQGTAPVSIPGDHSTDCYRVERII